MLAWLSGLPWPLAASGVSPVGSLAVGPRVMMPLRMALPTTVTPLSSLSASLLGVAEEAMSVLLW